LNFATRGKDRQSSQDWRSSVEALTLVNGMRDGYVLRIEDSGVVSVTGVTLQNLQAGPGSAVLNSGAALVADSTLGGNSSWIGDGIANWGTMKVTDSRPTFNWLPP
jgi:hypothetical protein